jgi:hypothetical protein
MEESRRFYQAIRRKELKKQYRDEAEKMETPTEMDEYAKLLSNERCQVLLTK